MFRTFQGYGEDFGGDLFKRIDFDSVDDFDGVFDERIVGGGGHPWGLVRGSSRSRVSLYPQKADGGYIFRLSGNPNWSVMELVKCYLTLGAAIPHLNKNLFRSLLIGLPSLAEQKRIVAEILLWLCKNRFFPAKIVSNDKWNSYDIIIVSSFLFSIFLLRYWVAEYP